VNFQKTIPLAFALALLISGRFARAEEQHSILHALSSTTLSGYVDTSVSWWVGIPGIDNDFARNATAVETNSISIPNTLTNSTLEVGESAQPQQKGSVWYKWTATQSGVARIATKTITPVTPVFAESTTPALSEESIFYPDGGITYVGGSLINTMIDGHFIQIGYQKWSTALAVYRFVQISNTEARLEFVQRGGSLQFDAHAGETFWIAIEVYQHQPFYEWQPEIPSELPTDLHFDLTPAPVNDLFVSTFSIANSAGGFFSGYTLAATREPGEPNLGGAFAGASVWFHYTAATYGLVTVGSQYNTAPFAIFAGADLAHLTVVAKAEGGATSFFGEEGKLYHIAVYESESAATGFVAAFVAPQYRLYETNVDTLFPTGLTPHFYGVRGVTMLLYSKTATGWQLVEVEPIVDRATDLLIRPPEPLDGQLRVLTIDDAMPSPRVAVVREGESLAATIVGIPGQTCAVSFSTDLSNWSEPQVITLKASTQNWRTFDDPNLNYFFRVTQSLPIRAPIQNLIGLVQTQLSPVDTLPPPAP
jgi:hypothetical protein